MFFATRKGIGVVGVAFWASQWHFALTWNMTQIGVPLFVGTGLFFASSDLMYAPTLKFFVCLYKEDFEKC
jgi:hypothetical protein